MSHEFKVRTKSKEEFIDITSQISSILKSQNVREGLVHIFIPHTTAAVTINENADPDVVHDILKGLKDIVPRSGFRHMEGNSPAHIKSSIIGPSLCINVKSGELMLGTWQGIYFCEFDGPRERKVWIAFSS